MTIKDQEFESDRIDEHLKEILKTQPYNEKISVFVVLKDQPAHDISKEVKKEYRNDFDNITVPAREIYSRIRPLRGNEEELRKKDLSEIIKDEQSLLTDQEKAVLNEIGDNIDSKRREMRREILGRTIPKAVESQSPLISRIEARGGRIRYSSKIFNAIIAEIPKSYIEELSKEKEIFRIYSNNILKASLDTSNQAMGANTWWNNGFTGSSIDAAIIDTGIDNKHPELRVDYAEIFHGIANSDPDYYDNPMFADDYQGHGTHVAGIVASTDSNYKGVAYGIDKLINAKAGWRAIDGYGYMYISDSVEAVDWSIFGNPDDADVISLSYGGGTTNGNSVYERFFDAIIYDLDIPVVISAGNEGPGGGTITNPAGAYNVIAVGNIYDNNTILRTDDYLLSSSSRGPTMDGRIKPDISAPGTDIISTAHDWEGSNPNFVSMTGTSMAAPQITGSILLMLDYKNSRWQPEAVKALLLNTAEDRGAFGPDNDYGFGYVNLTHTYIHRDDVYTGSIYDSPAGEVEKFYKGSAYAGDKATLVWNRHATYNSTNFPALNNNDIDLFMFDESSGSPISSSTSRVNNVEQVESDENYNSVVIKIDPSGHFASGIGMEDYALATEEGFSQVAPPHLNVTIYNQGSVNGGADFNVYVNVTNIGEISAHNVSVNLTVPAGFSIVDGTNPWTIGSINNGSSRTASWVVKATASAPSAQYTLDTSVSSLSYDERFSGQANSTIWVNSEGYINGTVLNNGIQISGAIISTNTSISTITDYSGFYSLRVPGGTYYLTAIKEPKYYPYSSVVVTAELGSTVVKDIELMEKPNGMISGAVTNT